jgi:hypothetical protein
LAFAIANALYSVLEKFAKLLLCCMIFWASGTRPFFSRTIPIDLGCLKVLQFAALCHVPQRGLAKGEGRCRLGAGVPVGRRSEGVVGQALSGAMGGVISA